MEMVADTSALVAVIANEPERDALVRCTIGADLIAPHSVHWEVGNALCGLLKRRRVALEQALSALEAYQRIPVRFVHVELDKTLRLAHSLGLHAYDAYLLRCALKYKSPLLSLDQALVQAAQRVGVQIVQVGK